MKRQRSPMGQVRVELVRHGPPHNQLLSPLTPYLALCNNQSGEGFTVPIEHGEFLDLVAGMPEIQEAGAASLRLSRAQEMVVERLRAIVTELLGSLSSLRSEVARGIGTQHLRLVLSAAELSALPFELADAPSHYPGAGKPLLLGEDDRFVLTRETRRAHARPARWPERPRILFASYGASDNDVPTEAHLLALYKAVRPWIGWSGGIEGSAGERVREFEGHLTVIRRASLRDIEEACAAGEFTHVHVLAHGALTPDVLPHRAKYGVLLRGDDGGEDHVDGGRLALALTSGREPPAVVTLATCDGGNVGSVIVGGGSVAHALHDAGVGLVVASQFPLTQPGSVVMAGSLYNGFLRGEDPRTTLIKARRALKSRVPHALDWASLVCYASLREDLHRELAKVRYTRLRKAADVVEFRARATLTEPEDDPERVKREAVLDGEVRKLQDALRRGEPYCAAHIASLLLRRFDGLVDARTEPLDRRALEARREVAAALLKHSSIPAPASHFTGLPARPPEGVFEVSALRPRELLGHAARSYERFYTAQPRYLWSLAQVVFLRAVLKHCDLAGPSSPDELTLLRLLAARANAAADRGDPHVERSDAVMALVVATLLTPKGDHGWIPDRVVRLMHEVPDGPRGFRAFSERRVLRRVAEWLPETEDYKDAIKVAWQANLRCRELDVPDRWPER